NGSINLSGISFANFGELFVYARGSGSNLTFASPVSNLQRVHLRAENDITLTAPVTVTGTDPNKQGFKAQAGNNIEVSSTVKSNQMSFESLGSIQITSSAQLLAMLNGTNSGEVVILATGSRGSVDVDGQVQAEQGTVDIRETGDNGIVNINGAMLHGDIVKIGALGANGVLNIGGGTLSANSVLELYAPSSNGMIRFVANCTIGGSTANIIAAGTVAILNGVTVDVTGKPVDVITTPANYTGVGGNGSTTGTFTGLGATNPQPLANAPPFDQAPRSLASPGNKVAAGGKPTNSDVINVTNSGQLLSLLDAA